jgi:hypothetical protein
MLATALLGAFLFLLVASFLVLPCLTAAGSDLFSSVAGPQSCQEHKMFQAQTDLTKIRFLPAEGVFRFLVALPVLFAASVLAYAAAADAHARPRGSIRARSGMLPFVTSDPPRLPAFGALRDA